MRTASALNHITPDHSAVAAPAKIGDGATVLAWTDRYAATVVKVTPRSITVREDTATRTDKNGMSESQSYEYAPNPEGREWTFTLRADGKFYERGAAMGKGYKLLVGERRAYHDYSF
jgi:hypothetical protein